MHRASAESYFQEGKENVHTVQDRRGKKETKPNQILEKGIDFLLDWRDQLTYLLTNLTTILTSNI